jgi:hypothetical protein
LKGSFPKPTRRLSVLGLVAVLALSLAVVTASAGASSWHAASAGDAVAAKKKCKKKHRSASSAKKKKKCKHKKKVTPTPPVVTPPRGPIERILLTWSGDADLDAHAWSNGLHDGWSELNDRYEIEIPGTTYENSNNTPNRERVVELNPNPSITPMTFGICYYAGPGSTDDGETDATVTTVFSSGASDTEVVPVDYGDALTHSNEEGGAPDPVEDWCPSPF